MKASWAIRRNDRGEPYPWVVWLRDEHGDWWTMHFDKTRARCREWARHHNPARY